MTVPTGPMKRPQQRLQAHAFRNGAMVLYLCQLSARVPTLSQRGAGESTTAGPGAWGPTPDLVTSAILPTSLD